MAGARRGPGRQRARHGVAALVALCEFPGRAFFAWALLLPLAVPTYVLATVYIGLLDYAGPVQTLLRKHLPGIPTIEVRNHWGVLAVLVRTFP